MNKTSAVEVKKNALEAVKNLLQALEVANQGYDAEEFENLHRAVGILVGEIQVGILDPVYSVYEDLSDIAD